MTNISQTEGASNGQSTRVNAFAPYSLAGFLTELLPIMPPDAALSEHSKIDPDSRGKTPGRMYSNAWGGFPGWQGHFVTTGDVKRWSRWPGVGVGLQARKHPGVDIDVLDEAASEALGELAEKHLGAAPERIGNPPKRLLAYRLEDGADPFKKRRVEFTLPDDPTKHAVEVLGDGQQYVIEGVHAKTGNPYTWTNGSPADWTHDGLTGITASGADTYMDAVRAEVERLGGTVLGASQGGAGDGAARPQEGLAGDPETVREALEALGNDQPYDEWIKLVAACKAALGEDGYDVYEAWCLQYPDNTPEVARHKWDSCHPPFRVGAQLIYEKAAEAGWTGYGAAVGFTPVHGTVPQSTSPHASGIAGDDTWNAGFVLPGPGVSDPTPDFVRDWVYVEDQEKFYHVPDAALVSEAVYARRYAAPGMGVNSAKNPKAVYFEKPERRMAAGLTYRPGAPRFPILDGRRYVNEWQVPEVVTNARTRPAAATDQDVQPWLDHAAYLIPDAKARGTVLDWIAYVLQHPASKPNWALFLGSEDQGTGKDTLFLPLLAGAGEGNTEHVDPADLTGPFNEWVAKRRLVVVQEMTTFDKKSQMDSLKKYIPTPPDTITVNLKHRRPYTIPNNVTFLFMSNEDNALKLEDSDRRYFVYWSPAKPKNEAYYTALHRWLAGGGTEAVVSWLLARDLSAFNAKGRAPHTTAKADMIEASHAGWEQLIRDAIQAGDEAPFCYSLVRVREVASWLQRHGGKHQPSPHAIGKALKRAGAAKLDAKADMRSGGDGTAQTTLWALRNAATYRAKGGVELRAAYLGERAGGFQDDDAQPFDWTSYFRSQGLTDTRH